MSPPTDERRNRQIAKSGGGVSKTARLEIERKLGKSVVSPLNAKDIDLLTTTKQEKIDETDDE